MPSYFPTAEEILASDDFGMDLRKEDMGSINFARKPWAPPPFRPEQKDEEFRPTTPGDVDFLMRRYLVDAQVPSAHSEKLLNDAKETARDALEKWGDVVDPETRKRWLSIAETGTEQPKSSWFKNFLNVLDTPGELVRMLAAQAAGVDKRTGGFTLQDYVDAALGNDASVIERHPWIAEEGEQALATTANTLKLRGAEDTWATGVLGFVGDVALDPLTYVSFGTLGFGKKAAMEAASSGIAKAAREGLEASAKGTAKELTDTASKEYVRRLDDLIKRRADDMIHKTDSAIERQQIREHVRREVLKNEEQALKFMENVPLGRTAGAVNLPGSSVLQEMVEGTWAKLADKQFRSLAKESPWYTSSKHIPEFAKGGIHVGMPFGSKRFSLLRIPGTETDRAVTRLLGREQIGRAYDKLPQSFRSMMRKLGRRSDVNDAIFESARRGQLWDIRVAAHAVEEIAGAALDVAAVTPLNQGIRHAEAAFNSAEEAHRALARALSGDSDYLLTLPDAQREAVRIAAYGSASEGIDGIHHVLQTFWDAARRSGMDLGHAEGYVPRVMRRQFANALDDMAAEGVDVARHLDEASSEESRVGMELLSRYIAVSGDIASGRAIDPSYAKHADNTTALHSFQSGLGGEHIDGYILSRVSDALNTSGLRHIPPHSANEYITAALDDLARLDPQNFNRSRVKALSEAFEEDMNKILSDYLVTMSDAIRFRETINQFRRIGLVAPEESLIDISATLSSVTGRLSPVTVTALREMGENGATRATSRLVDVKIGGRTFRIPSTVKASPRFGQVAKKLSKALSTVDRRGRELTLAIERNARRMMGDGIPEEWAWRMALSETDAEFAFVFREMADIAREEVTTLRMGVAEMGARNMTDDIGELYRVVEDEAREIARGVEATMNEIREQVSRKLNVPEVRPSAVDLMDPSIAPRGYANPMAYLADQAMESIVREQGSVEDAMRAVREGLTLGQATRPQIAAEAVRDLADRLTVHNVTVGDLADFANPGAAARILHEANLRLVYSGYAGVGSLTDEMAELVDVVLELESSYWFARQAGSGTPELEALRSAERALNEAAQPLRNSEELLGDIVDHMADSVEDINDIVLTGDAWKEVWATAIHKQGLGSRAEFREAMLEGMEKGLPEMTQKQLLQRGSKTVSRELAEFTTSLWIDAGMGPTAAIAARAKDALMIGDHWAHRAIAAMRAGDMQYMSTHTDQVRLVIGRITGKDGRPIFDLDRLTFRNGRFVYEPESVSFVTLDDIMDDLRRIMDSPDDSDFDIMAAARNLWAENPQVMESVNPLIGDFFRQLDAVGGMPQAIEDYDYLRRFLAELETGMPRYSRPGDVTIRETVGQLSGDAHRWEYLGDIRLGLEGSRIIPWDDLPDHVYHVTVAGRAVEESGVLRARIAGQGLGGDAADAASMSVTINRLTAEQLAQDMKRVAQLYKLPDSTEEVMGFLRSWAEAEGFLPQYEEHLLRVAKDAQKRNMAPRVRDQLLDDFLFTRQNATGKPDPVFLNKSALSNLDPNDIDIVVIPKSNLPRDGLFTDFDLDVAGGLSEVRVWGDIPLRADVVGGTLRTITPGSEALRNILDMIPDVYRRAGRGGSPSRLVKAWDSAKELISEALPADEFDKLAELVGFTISAGRLRPPVWRESWKRALGTAEEAFDAFTSEIAALRRVTADEGAEWGARVAEDIHYFHEQLAKVLSWSNSPGPHLRPGYQGLVERGSEFDETLKALNAARKRLRNSLNKARQDKVLTEFLPDIPQTGMEPKKWLERLIDDLDKPFKAEGARILTGETVRPVVQGVAGEAVQGLVMSPAVAAYLENMAVGAAAMVSPLGIRLATQAMREMEKWWKSAVTVARPTFVPRNVLGGVVNGLLIGVGPRHYAFVRNHVYTLKNLMRDGATFDEALLALPKKVQPTFRALWDSKLLTTSFSQTIEGLRTVPSIGKRLNPFSHENQLFRMGGAFMEHSEDFLRAAAFVRWFDPSNPASAKLAKEMALVAHFDYSALTSLEVQIRRLVPFFVWTRRNIPLQMRAMMEQPGHILRIKHFTENVNIAFEDTSVDELGFAKPEWLSSFHMELPLVFGGDSAHWSRLLLNPDLPVNDIEELFDSFAPGNSGSAAEWLIRALSPFLSTPITSMSADYETVAPTGLREIMMVIDSLPGVDLQRKQGRAGGQYTVSGSTAQWFRTITPFLDEWVRVLGIVPSGGTQAARAGYNIEDGIDIHERLRASALGIGRAFGTHLQTPQDSYSQAWDAIFGVGDEIDSMQQRGFMDSADIDLLIETVMRREGQLPDIRGIREMLEREGIRSGKTGRYGTSR